MTTAEDDVTRKVRRIHEQLNEKRVHHQNQSQRNRVLECLMEEKRSGRIKGIFGRLGDLGAIDKQYDVAISTACPQLDHILVDNVDTGAQCIQYLKVCFGFLLTPTLELHHL